MYEVRAVRWEHGHIQGKCVTQSHTLAEAEAMVRDYLEMDDVPDAATARIVVTPESAEGDVS